MRLKSFILLVCIFSLQVQAEYNYNFPIDFKNYPEVKALDLSAVKKSDIRSTLLSITGQSSLLNDLFKPKITSLLFKVFPVEVSIVKEGAIFDGRLFAKNSITHATLTAGQEKYDELYTSTGECSEVEIDSKFYKVKESFYFVKKNFSGCNKKAELIYSYEFHKNTKSFKNKLSQNFLYLNDAAYEIPLQWKKPSIEFSVVGDDAFFSIVSESLSPYQKSLGKKIKIIFNKKESCEWASPVENCIIFFDSKEKKEDSSIHFAATNITANPSSGEIISADILLRKAEYEKWKENLKLMIDAQIKKTPESKAKLEEYYNTKSLQYLVNIITHEFGHALGLAHNFSEKNKSIMGYNQLIDLADYDHDALNELYKLKNKKRQSGEYELLKALPK